MNNIFNNALNVLDLVRLYPASLYKGFKNRKIFNDVETCCMFIGYRRSGKTLIASLLDAHPNMIIADELGVLKYIYAGFNHNQIYYLLLKNSQSFIKNGRISKGCSFKVDSQWQGRFKKLLVIGDNQGEGFTLRLRARPQLLKRLSNTIGVNIKLIHVTRNPYDNISAIFDRKKPKLDMEKSIEYYFSLCETVLQIKKQLKGTGLFELRHEYFVYKPKTYLRNLCHFLGVEASDDYLNDCANIVFKSPYKSRNDTKWNRRLINIVKNNMARFAFLEGYSYEE